MPCTLVTLGWGAVVCFLDSWASHSTSHSTLHTAPSNTLPPPPFLQINYVTWSPDSTCIAFTLRSAGGDADPPREPLELWVADIAAGGGGSEGCARRLMDLRLNSTFEE